jgi:hypothetical protein
MLAVVVVVVVGALVAVAVVALGGSGSKSPASSSGATTHAGTTRAKARLKASSKAKATSQPVAADTAITVLNGTETTGLAHRVSATLQQRGFSQAAALAGRPAGANQSSVVEYVAGHQAEAEAVAHSLSISQVQPLEATVIPLSGSAKVVVIVGADKAATSP